MPPNDNKELLEDDDQEDEFLVHTTAPATAAFDKIYREQANQTLNFVPVNRIHVGTISWPRKRAFWVNEEEYKLLATKKAKLDDRENSSQTRPQTPLTTGSQPSITPYRPSWPPPVPEIVVEQTGLHTPQKSSRPPHPQHEERQKPETLVPYTVLRTPLKSSSYASPQEQEEHEYLSQVYDSWCSSPSIPDSQPSQIRSSRGPPPSPSVCADTPCPPQRLPSQIPGSRVPLSPRPSQRPPSQIPNSQVPSSSPSICADTPCPSQRPSSLPSRNLQRKPDIPPPPLFSQSSPQASSAPQPPLTVPETPPPPPVQTLVPIQPDFPTFPRLTDGLLLTVALRAPTAASLEIPAGFSPVPESPLSVSALTSQPFDDQPPPFDPICPLPTLVDPPYTIISPSPATSSSPPQVPIALYDLVESKLKGKFQSRLFSQTRSLRRWERGYWKVDMFSWQDPIHKTNFWKQVKDSILAGRLGMVTMSIETEEFLETKERWGEDWGWRTRDREMMEKRGNLVRVYCWGGTVELVWCVLYVIGYRGMDGAVWVDAGGETVVRMV
ncbi:hypothetical protein K440DRAFT_658824 [Wilcoxina mikolae CBS 423.85]|nr:hypothetical protein K440DRAFT_658824 [Wilcoxina mikolae CBS 423.85]